MNRRYLFDSGPAYDFIFRRRDVYDRAIRLKRAELAIGICPPIAGEIRAGVESSTIRSKNIDIAGGILDPFECGQLQLKRLANLVGSMLISNRQGE